MNFGNALNRIIGMVFFTDREKKFELIYYVRIKLCQTKR